ncbi:sulfatase-like hydrolase/transferase [Limobrevibacterium gyesilva]|uniref:sulfatase-like hydrolase/transferase n=1 Tax=Limobrevibacterium gyesilva TaxID=2991712 RepID=UPI002226F268
MLLIIADQWRGDSLSVLGHPAALTPDLDALAGEGVLFRNHFGQSAPCGPARASMLTGQYVMNHRVVANGVPLDARHPNLATEVRRAGMDPALVGYTTTTPDPRLVPHADPRFAEIGDVMDGFRTFAHFDEVDFRTYMGWVASRGFALPEDPQDIWRPLEGPAGPSAAPSRIPAALSDTAWSGTHGIEFLRTTRPGRPWLLHLGFFRPHPPFAAPAPYHDMVPEARIPAPLRAATRAAEAAQHPMLAHWLGAQMQASYFQGATGPVSALSDRAVMLTRRAYYGLIAEIDHWVGEVLAELRRSGQWDDTLIVFTSDHGEQLGDHHLLSKLGWFDQSYHLPLIIRDPSSGATRGRVVDAFTEAVDLMPTILDWLGLDVPACCDGVSLRPWLAGGTPATWRDAVHFEYDLRGGWPQPSRLPADISPDVGPMAAMRTARWKYVHFTGLEPVLYDLAADPGELRNVAADPAYRGLRAEAASRMLSWRMAHAEVGLTRLVASPAGLTQRTLPARH